jgi:flagellar basal body-associated protein FliL
MAEKAERKPEAQAHPPKEHADKKEGGADKKAAPGAGGMLTKTPVLLGIVMIIEAAVLFAGFKFLGGGAKTASAVELSHEEGGHDEHGDEHGDGHGGGATKKGPTEKERPVDVLQNFKAINGQNGRRFIYDVTVSAWVKGEFEEKVRERIKARDALIRDRMRTIIAQMDPDKLAGGSEPGLETLRRQIKSQLEIIIGDGMIEEVLVPQCTVFRADF